ncbi:MAG: hypothetical protein PHI34_12565, partial [Acidobacteriota bacterium]|nr:hypothetical protein [Acidobacteriota bacterium]
MAERKRGIPVWLAVLVLLPSLLIGYGNDGPGGGPHRRLNALALSRFIQAAAKDPILKHYDFQPTLKRYGLPDASRLFLVESKTVTKSGAWHRGETIWPGVTATYIEEGLVRNPFAWWVAEGGYTADEPESYMALRHFYDPLGRGTDAETGTRASYLTDSLDAYMSPIMMGHNPRLDAKTWATSESPYSWGRAQQSLDYIDAMDFGDKDRDKEFGAVWRSLGEILHLLADMTLPAHVRNDSHPGAWWPKRLNSDPYEDYVDADVATRCAAGAAPDAIRSALSGIQDPGSLMHAVALFTNRNFFSKDTISGRDAVTGEPVVPANGQPAYPSPKLESYRFESSAGGMGFYETPNGLFAPVGRLRDGSHAILTPTLVGQALALIPAAVEAEVKMIDLFMPRVRVIIDGFDDKTSRLRFHALRFQTDESGAFSVEGRPTHLWSSPQAVVLLSHGDAKRASTFLIESGDQSDLSLDLSGAIESARERAAAAGKALEADCVVGLDMGGILVRSEPFKIVIAPPTAPPTENKPVPGGDSVVALLGRCVGVHAIVYGKFEMRGYIAHETTNEIEAGNFDWFTEQKLRYKYPLRWAGMRFSTSYSYREESTPTAQDPHPIITYTCSVTGQISEDGRKILSLTIIKGHSG